MILEYKQIDLFGKMLFARMIADAPFKQSLVMENEACFLHLKAGELKMFAEQDVIETKKNQSVLMKCGQFIGHLEPDKESMLIEMIAIHFHPEILKKIYEGNIPSFLTSNSQKTTSTIAKLNASILVNKYFEDILFYFEHQELINDDILILKLREIILLLMQTDNADRILLILKNLFTERTVNFKQIIEVHIFSELSIDELAELTNLSLSSFKRKFKETYQTSPSNYIQSKRLEKAKELLAVSDLSITNIAYDCSFKSVSHFSKKFKETYGLSPSDIRLDQSDK